MDLRRHESNVELAIPSRSARSLGIALARSRLSLVVAVTLSACAWIPRARTHARATPFVSTECGFHIDLPDGWVATSTEPDFVDAEHVCAVALKPRTWEGTIRRSPYDVPEFAIYIEVFAGTLANACETTLVCRDDDGTWWMAGRMGRRDRAAIVSAPLWDAVQGVSETGRYRKEGGYAGPAKAFVALLDGRNGRLALLVADNEMDDQTVFDRIMRSFRFGA